MGDAIFMKDAAQNRTALSYDSKFFISKVHTISTIIAQPSILYQYIVYFLGYQNVHALIYIETEVLFFPAEIFDLECLK